MLSMQSMCLVSVGLLLLHRDALAPASRLRAPTVKRQLTKVQCTFRHVIKTEHYVQLFGIYLAMHDAQGMMPSPNIAKGCAQK